VAAAVPEPVPVPVTSPRARAKAKAVPKAKAKAVKPKAKPKAKPAAAAAPKPAAPKPAAAVVTVAAVAVAPAPEEDLSVLKVAELRSRLQAQGLDTIGKKAQLVARLAAALNGAAAGADAAPAATLSGAGAAAAPAAAAATDAQPPEPLSRDAPSDWQWCMNRALKRRSADGDREFLQLLALDGVDLSVDSELGDSTALAELVSTASFLGRTACVAALEKH